jgi:hypothetical protein
MQIRIVFEVDGDYADMSNEQVRQIAARAVGRADGYGPPEVEVYDETHPKRWIGIPLTD